MIRMILPVAVVAGLLAPADDPPSEAVKRELERHRGAWQVESLEREGKSSPPGINRSIRRGVEGDRAVWERDGEVFARTRIELDPTVRPAAIDVVPEEGPSKGRRVLGIYRLEGHRLTNCTAAPGDPRPREFQAEPGTGRTLTSFRREPPPKGSEPPSRCP
jgi:uncharacterized protein (TIGR03067 family)